MKIAYFDCFSGAAGDMIMGALLDAGLPYDDFKAEIRKIGLSGYELSSEHVTKHQIAATKFTVKISGKQPYRSLREITEIITDSGLSESAREKSIAIFNRLAEAEAAAHGEPVEKVHFHEIGAVDAIIDICGAVAGLEMMGIEKIYCSPLVLGTGSVQTDHGPMPVPAPATVELTRNIPVRFTGIESELTTPTGAAIITKLADFMPPERFIFEKVGYGAGSRDLPDLPNLLRIMIGEIDLDLECDNVTIMETNLDRATPEALGGVIDELLAAGALDVFVTPVTMKKNRPGHGLTLICEPDKKDKLAGIVFTRGLTLGIRVETVSRIKLPRRETKVTTSGGIVSVKIAVCDGRKIILPEFDDVTAAMKKAGKSYEDIYFEIRDVLGKEQ